MAENQVPCIIAVGIDTARYGHRVAFLGEDRRSVAPALTVTENHEGYQRLLQQLQQLQHQYPEACFRVHLDVAGQYAANLERFLRSLDLPMSLSIGEPKRNKDYHKAVFPKRTTDDTESIAMARFALAERPAPTLAVPDELFALREIASRLQGQVRDTTRITNRLHNVLARVFPEMASLITSLKTSSILLLLKAYPTPARLVAARRSSLARIPYLKLELAEKLQTAARNSVASFRGELAEKLVGECVQHLLDCQKREKRLEKLLLQALRSLPAGAHGQLVTIPGIGEVTAAVLVAKIVSMDRFATPEQLVGYFGIFPEENSSGVDPRGNPVRPGSMKMSAKGSDLVRRYLWNAAKSAVQHNPAVKDLYARLRAKGTRGDVALGHCMRKLLRQVHGVWASNTPYDEQLARSRHVPEASEPNLAQPAVPVQTEPAEMEPAAPQPPIETAAGHKRDVLPERTVVTAANINVAAEPKAVKPQRSIDFAHLRQQVTFEQILTLLGAFDRFTGSGRQRRGSCPLHDSAGHGQRDFSVHLDKQVFRCFHPECSQAGNVLDFWAALQQLPLYEAALDLAKTFHLTIQPEQRRGTRIRTPQTVSRKHVRKGVITPDAT